MDVSALEAKVCNVYTTFAPHFKGKRRCINGIIALLPVLWNALMRNGGVVYKTEKPSVCLSQRLLAGICLYRHV